MGRYHAKVTQETAPAGSGALMLNRITILVSFIGIFIAGTLSFSHLTNKMPPCGSSGGCTGVLSSPFASFFGLPVAYIGLGAYFALAAISVLRSTKAGADWTMLIKVGFGLTAVGVLASFWFTFASLVYIQEACLWCLGSAATMIALFFLHASLWGKNPPEEPGQVDVLASVAGLVLAMTLFIPSAMAASVETNRFTELVNVDKATRETLLPSDPQRIWGNKDAKVILVEFADPNCPSCRRAYQEVKKLIAPYMQTIAFAYRNLPLFQIPGHETSVQVAVAMEYAAENGKYREFYEKIFEEGNTARIKEVSGILSIAREVGLNSRELSSILSNKADYTAKLDELTGRVSEEMNLAQSFNITGTPTFILYAEGVGAKAVTGPDIQKTLNSEPYLSLLKEQ
jgi:protein-disulfide isomerase/uncharacterized membrane protein